eukprot:Nk52_evm16s2309 gene=Nk52_evmTU16s2309
MKQNRITHNNNNNNLINNNAIDPRIDGEFSYQNDNANQIKASSSSSGASLLNNALNPKDPYNVNQAMKPQLQYDYEDFYNPSSQSSQLLLSPSNSNSISSTNQDYYSPTLRSSTGNLLFDPYREPDSHEKAMKAQMDRVLKGEIPGTANFKQEFLTLRNQRVHQLIPDPDKPSLDVIYALLNRRRLSSSSAADDQSAARNLLKQEYSKVGLLDQGGGDEENNSSSDEEQKKRDKEKSQQDAEQRDQNIPRNVNNYNLNDPNRDLYNNNINNNQPVIDATYSSDPQLAEIRTYWKENQFNRLYHQVAPDLTLSPYLAMFDVAQAPNFIPSKGIAAQLRKNIISDNEDSDPKRANVRKNNLEREKEMEFELEKQIAIDAENEGISLLRRKTENPVPSKRLSDSDDSTEKELEEDIGIGGSASSSEGVGILPLRPQGMGTLLVHDTTSVTKQHEDVTVRQNT